MTPPRRRHGPHALTLVAALLGLVLPVLALPAAPAASAAPPAARGTQTAPAPLPVTLTVDDLRPRAPRPGDNLQVLGQVQAGGDEPLTGLQLRVRVGSRLSTRGQLHQADTGPVLYGSPAAVLPLPDLAPGAQAPLDVRLPVDQLGLTLDGVYPLQLEVRGLRGTDPVRAQLGAVSTYLPWFGDRTVDPLRIAWVWPLVDTPRLEPDDLQADDSLAASVLPSGRLGASLHASRAGEAGQCPTAAQAAPGPSGAPPAKPGPPVRCTPVHVTYAADPDLLYTLDHMTRPYDVGRRGRTQAGTGSAQAAAWLASLRSATREDGLLALPYADPDVVALTRGSAGLAADVATARAYGVTVTRDLLGVDPVQSVAFPPAGPLTDAAYDALTTPSTQALVLGDDAVTPPPEGGRSTPGARVELPPSATSGPVTGLVVDRGLSDLLVPDRTRWQGPRLAEQRWLVETAMISAELPSRGRTLLVAPPRRAALDPALLAGAVVDTGAAPWMCGVSLADVVASRERCAGAAAPAYGPNRSAQLTQGVPVTLPVDAQPLAPTAVRRTARVRAASAQLTDQVIKGGTEAAQALRARMQRAWLRTESSAWRDAPAGGARLTTVLAQEVARLADKVSVLTGRVTLTSNNGRVSVAVVNQLDQPVTLRLRLTAPSDARLSRTETDLLEVPASTSLPVQVVARTLTSGRFAVKAQLLDREGQPFGTTKELVVTSTRYGSVALAITGLGAAVLLLAAGARLVRRALVRGRTA